MFGLGLVGCATTSLEPAPEALTVTGQEDAAHATVGNVRVVAQAEELPGMEPAKHEIIPMRVVIENNSGKPLRVAYNEFALVTSEGETYSALPLYKIEGTVESPVSAGAYSPITEPGFAYDNFTVAPYLGTYYPGISPVTDPFYYDPLYYGTNYAYWEETTLPTTAMRALALPEGVVESGGRVEGWLYFENIHGANEVVFRADLINSRTGDEFGEIRIPFEAAS